MPQNETPVPTLALPPDERESPPVEQAYIPTPGKDPSTMTEAEKQLQAFLLKVQLANQPEPPPPPPPAPTDRQAEQTRIEMEAGARTSAKHLAQQAYRPKPAPEPSEGKTVSVFRPEDYVPNLRSKTDAQRGFKQV